MITTRAPDGANKSCSKLATFDPNLQLIHSAISRGWFGCIYAWYISTNMTLFWLDWHMTLELSLFFVLFTTIRFWDAFLHTQFKDPVLKNDPPPAHPGGFILILDPDPWSWSLILILDPDPWSWSLILILDFDPWSWSLILILDPSPEKHSIWYIQAPGTGSTISRHPSL